MPKVILAQYRSGGSYLSQALSNGAPILTEPGLPDDGFLNTLTENVKIFLNVVEQIKAHGVTKLSNFKNFVGMFEDRHEKIPPDVQLIFLYRHPYTQIASVLFKFHEWDDNWADRRHFWEAIAAYREHFQLCESIKSKVPGCLTIRYEDAIGDGLPSVLAQVYGDAAANYLDYALAIQNQNFPLGPRTDGTEWEPSTYELKPKEKYWVAQNLGDVMEALDYGR